MSILVIDVGTSGVRAASCAPTPRSPHEHHREVLPDSPAAGLVEFDAAALADAALELARAGAGRRPGRSTRVGIANQRASTIVWDRATGEPVGPGTRLAGPAHGRRLPRAARPRACASRRTCRPPSSRACSTPTTPTAPATCASARSTPGSRGGCRAAGARHRPVERGGHRADRPRRHRLGRPRCSTRCASPRRCCPRSSTRPAPSARPPRSPGAPPIAGIAGDQQASLIGQGCVAPGPAKITFGTGGMLDVVVGPERPRFDTRGGGGTFPIVAWRRGGETTWGLEAIMLSAGTNVEWLRDDLGHHRHQRGVPRRRPAVRDDRRRRLRAGAARPGHAAVGLRRPRHPARPHPRRRAAADRAGRARGRRPARRRPGRRGRGRRPASRIDALRIDGGMSRNPTFVQALADATQRPVEVSPVVEATTLGAAFLAGLAIGTWSDLGRHRRHVGARRPPSSRARRSTASAGPTPCERARRLVPRAVGPRLLSAPHLAPRPRVSAHARPPAIITRCRTATR